MLRFDVVLDHVVGWALLAPVPDDNARTPHNLAGLALCVEFAKTGPFAEFHVGIDLDQGNLTSKK
jgi:hypothetical protein